MKTILAVLLGLAAIPAVYAGLPPTPIPEPDLLGLLAIGGVAGVIVGLRKRRK